MDKLYKYKAWVAVLKDILNEYSGLTIDNVVKQLEARIKELEK